MSENQLNRQLAAGIRAAQQGNRERARELLEGVIRRDRNNEQAWIWLASVVDNQRERRLSLERVLKINPGNTPAQQSLNSMIGVLGNGEQRAAIDFRAISAAARTPPPAGGSRNVSPAERSGTPSGDGGSNLLPFLFGGAIVLGILLLGSIFIPPLLAPDPTPTPQPTLFVASPTGPTADPSIPTQTPTPLPSATFDSEAAGAIATNTPSGPTFTPTVTFTPSSTPEPTATLPSVLSYDYLVLGSRPGGIPGIFEVSGDGTTIENILSDVRDFDFNPATGALVYTRARTVTLPTTTPRPTFTPDFVTPSASSTQDSGGGGGFVVQPGAAAPVQTQLSQMFVTNINNLEDVVELTSSSLQNAIEPAISPDGNFVAFASDVDGDLEIFIYDVSTGLSEQLTDNFVFEDTQPQWSPGGDYLIFSSDRISAGNNDVFTIDPFDSDPGATVVQITDTRGRAEQPQLSPDESRIVFLSFNEGNSTLRLATADGSSVRDLTFQPDLLYGAPAWTRDGNYIVYSVGSPDDGNLELHIYEPSSNTDRVVNLENFSSLFAVPLE